MIESLLSGNLCELRKKIRELTGLSQNSPAGQEPVWPEKDLLRQLSQLLRTTIGNEAFFWTGKKKTGHLVWLTEEIAAHFPEYGLQLAVQEGLIRPVLELSGLSNREFQKLSRIKSNEHYSMDQINHLFLPLPAKKMFQLKVGREDDAPAISERRWNQLLPVFSGLPLKRILIPVAAEESKSASCQVVSYYFFESQSFKSYDHGPARRYFPLRPARCELGLDSSRDRNQEPILSLEPGQFQSLLAGYYLLLTSCFSGWLRASWKSLVSRRPLQGWQESQESEICFLATELGRLQLGLYRLSQPKPGLPADFLARVEKLGLKGFHLASRSWKYLSQAGDIINLRTGEER